MRWLELEARDDCALPYACLCGSLRTFGGGSIWGSFFSTMSVEDGSVNRIEPP